MRQCFNCVTGCVIQEMERADFYKVPIIHQLVYKEGTSVHCFLQSSYTFLRLGGFARLTCRSNITSPWHLLLLPSLCTRLLSHSIGIDFLKLISTCNIGKNPTKRRVYDQTQIDWSEQSRRGSDW